MKTINRQSGKSTPAADWANKDSLELIEHIIKRYHDYLRRELPRISHLFQEVAEGRLEQPPEFLKLKEIYESFRTAIEEHREKEEQVFYPLCHRLEANGNKISGEGDDVQGWTDELMQEHGEVEDALAWMSDLTHCFKAPADASDSLRELLAGLAALKRDTHEHIYVENEVLFPKVILLG